ncbi:DNA processing protein [Nakamurella panacisegetis]|uniref:DNA processing protein n=1 Tax=Nakamurella panacisegetis TaxID=1090615 RepID=A0A1H0RL57_9ACTN|nr:DNA-processing protein DprA [Nakamurella panacisegetis]SDP30130.1 DNA processing protein [Nakamurella panacisegetis]
MVKHDGSQQDPVLLSGRDVTTEIGTSRRPPEAEEELRRSWAGLLRAYEPPDAALAGYVERVGARAAWTAIRDRRAPRSVLLPTAARTEQFIAAELEALIDTDLAAAEAVGARLIGAGDPEWPEAAFVSFLMAASNAVKNAAPPVALYVRGRRLTNLPADALSIVGSRANTAYGQRVAADIAMGAADAGLTVISGAAFGIDTVAHRGAMAYDRESPTIAVLACGIDRAYPVANAALIDRIAQVGSVISEYPPGFSPARHRFLVRNRLIAALSAGTVVVEAGRRSGTLSTAGAADGLGRVLMAVPGPVTSALSVGCHLLLASGKALLVTSAEDVLATLGERERVEAFNRHVGLEPLMLPTEPPRPTERHPTDGLEPGIAKVYDALPARAARTVTQLSVESAIPSGDVIAALTVLELHDLVRRQNGAWRRKRQSDQ